MTDPLDPVRRAFAELRARIEHLEIATGCFVSEDTLDRPKGDPVVRFIPAGWKGSQDFKGQPFSKCPPALLEALAAALRAMAEAPAEGKEKYAGHNRRTAALARTWARRLRRAGAAARPPGGRSDDEDFIR